MAKGEWSSGSWHVCLSKNWDGADCTLNAPRQGTSEIELRISAHAPHSDEDLSKGETQVRIVMPAKEGGRK